MTATLDYSSFPHIFCSIMKHCDWRTQNGMRLLSSLVKVDVDRHQCRFIAISESLALHGEEDCSDMITALSRPLGVRYGIAWIFTPLLNRDPPTRARNAPWALRNTRHVAIVATSLLVAEPGDEVCTRTRLSLLERCTDLTLTYDMRYVMLHRVLAVPPFVQRLHVILITKYDDWDVPSLDLTHSCPKVTVQLEERSDLLRGLETIKGLLHPGVQHLVLVVNEPTVITPYILAIKNTRLHPDLLITVQTIQSAQLQSLRDEWAQIIDAKIEVQQSFADLRLF